MLNLPAKLACAFMILLTYAPVLADETYQAKDSSACAISHQELGPLAEPAQLKTQQTDRQNNETDEKTLERLDKLRLQYLLEQHRRADREAFVWFQAYEHESQNQRRQDVLLRLWRRQAEAQQSVTTMENSILELDPRIFTGGGTGDVEPMPFGASSFGPWSTGPFPVRP